MKHRITAMILAVCVVFTLVAPYLPIHAAEDGIISIEKDFTTREKYDMTWQQDAEVAEVTGNLTITPNTIRALGVGKQNSSSSGSGSVTYRVEAPEGNVIQTLSYSANGRAYHSTSNSECSAGNCQCGYEVSVSTDGGVSYTKVSTEEIVTSSATKDFNYDLTDLAAGKSSVLVKLYMSGKSWDWVSMNKISITGTYGEGVAETPAEPKEGEFSYVDGNYSMSRVFSTMTAYDKSFLNDAAVYDYSGNLLISPDGAYGLGVGQQGVTSTGSGHVSYLIDVPEGQQIATGKLAFTGRVYHSSSNSECSAGNCACEFELSVSTDGGATYQVVQNEPVVTAGATKDFEYDLTSFIAGKESAIVRIYMSGKSWNWIHIKNLTISGTYEEKSDVPVTPDNPPVNPDAEPNWPVIDSAYDEICGADFNVTYEYASLPAYDRSWQDAAYDYHFMERGPENAALGVGEKDVGADGTGYITYRFAAPEGKLLSEAHIAIKGRCFHYVDDPVCSKGECDCKMEIQVSTDGVNYKTYVTEYPGTYGAWNVGFRHDLNDAVRGAKVAYIRVQITSKNWDWISMTSLNVYGKYRDEDVGISGEVSVSPAGSLSVGDDFTLTAKLTNGSDASFKGRVELAYPTYYLSSENYSQNVDLAAGASVDLTFNMKALEGGYGNLFVCVYDETGALLDTLELLTYVQGRGFYLGDGHNHSYESDGRTSFLDNMMQLVEKRFSFILTADHDAKNPGNDAAQQAALAELKKTFDGEFIAIKGSEVTTSGNAHVLCYNFATTYETLTDTQTVIDGVINEGGLAFLAHPFLKGYYFKNIGEDPTKVDGYTGFTGVEIFNGETNWARGWEGGHVDMNLEFWDRLNLTGYRKYFGTADSDGHDAIIQGHGADALLLDALTEENVHEALGTGRFYMTTGPALRMDLGGVTFGESYFVQGSATTTLSIYAYDPDYAITKVELFKLVIGQSYEEAMANTVVLYERGEDTIHAFNYCQNITVKEGEIYRVAVYTERGSNTWSDDTSPGFAFGNPIWVEKEMTGITLTKPTKLTYEEGNVANFSGMTVTANYYDGTSKEVIGWFASGFDSSTVGTKEITVQYNGFSQSFSIDVGEAQGVVKTENGQIEMDRIFAGLAPYSQEWKNDEAVFEAGGNLTIDPNSKGLGVGKQNSSSTGAGYVSYLVEVPEGNVITSLKAVITGRMYHSKSNAACAAGECDCDFGIYISRNGGLSYIPVTDWDIDAASSNWGQTLEFDLTEAITDCGSVIVKIYMSGKSWNWTCIESLHLEGTYAEGEAIAIPPAGSMLIENGTITYDKDFTTLPQYDMSWAEDAAVFEQIGNLTVSPSHRCLGVGKRNVSSTGAGYVSYIVDLPEGNILTSLSFTAHGRAYHSTSGATCAAGECTCAFKVYISTDGGILYQEVGKHEINFEGSGWDHDFVYDFTDYIQNKKTAIIKIYMSGRSWDWVGFETFSIRGTYAEGEHISDVVLQQTITEDFSAIGVGNDDKWKEQAESSSNVGIGSGERPWLSVLPENGSWEGIVGELVYKVESGAGAFDALNVSGTARVFSYENSVAVFNIYVSTDGVNYTLVKALPSTTNGAELNTFSEDLLPFVGDSSVAYVKIEMQSGFWDWVCLKDIQIIGAVKLEKYTVTVMDGDQVIDSDDAFLEGSVWEKLPEKQGYTAELYLDAALTVPYHGAPILENTTLYVKWVPAAYKVTYAGTDLPEGSYNSESGLTLPTPVKEGYTFDGWYLTEDLSGDAVTEIATGTTGDITVYAKWTQIPVEPDVPVVTPPTGDIIGSVLAVMLLSIGATVALIRKKRF